MYAMNIVATNHYVLAFDCSQQILSTFVQLMTCLFVDSKTLYQTIAWVLENTVIR